MGVRDEAIDRVSDDLRASFLSLVDLEPGADPADVVLLGWDEARRTCLLDLDAPPECAIVRLAEQAQDLVKDLLHRAGVPGPWPRCAGHGHPMQPAVHDETAVWTCPADPGRAIRIGSLTTESQRLGIDRADPSQRPPHAPEADEPLDPVLDAALAPSLRDLHTTTSIAVRLADERWGRPFQATAVLWSVDGAGAGVGVDRREPAAARVVQAADALQEWAIEDLWRRGTPTNWPVCPLHPATHPLRPGLRQGIPTWCCPRGNRPVARIGELG